MNTHREWGHRKLNRIFTVNIVLLLALCLPIKLNAAHRMMTLDKTVKISDTIVHGKIVDASAQWVQDGRGKHIYTYATVECIGYSKGSGGQRIVVEWPGGTVGQIAEQVSEFQPLSVGEEVVLFLNKDLRPAVGIYSKSKVVQGKAYGLSGSMEVNQFLAAVADAAATPKLGLTQQAVHTVLPTEQVRELTTTQPVKAQPSKPAGQQESPPIPTGATLAGWSTIKSENFEGAWPNGWTCTYNYTSGGTGITWATETYLKHAGSRGGWPHASVADPNLYYLLVANPPPAPPIKSWMTYGPFSLVGATDARVTFWLRYDLGAGDKMAWMASKDGSNYYGYQRAGGNNGAWEQITFDLKSVPTIGNLCGQTTVYITFYCEADSVQTYNDGPFLDDIVIESYTAGGTPPSITLITPSSASAGTSNAVTITGSNFGASQGSSVVEFFYAPGESKIPASVTAWSDTSITCLVPEGASSGPVTVTTGGGTSGGYTFIVTFGYGGVKWPGASPTVSYWINENTADCTGEGAAVQSAAATWNSAGSKFAFQYAGATTVTNSSQNYVNEILWGTFSDPGIIAGTYIWADTQTMTIVECDIVFNDPDWIWDTSGSPSGSQMDVQTSAVHELGHWLLLDDLYGNIGDGTNDNGKIMYGFGDYGLVKRTLAVADRDGILWIYGLAPQADLMITKTDSPDPVLVGSNLTYSIIVSNLGPATASSVTVTDTLPATVTFTNATVSQGTWTNITGTVICNLGTLASNATATVTILVTPTAAGTITNTAIAYGTEPDPNPTNNTATAITTVLMPTADLLLTQIAAPNPVTVGDPLTYTIAVTNLGPFTASSVTITDTLPAQVTVVSATTSQGSCSTNGGLVVCSVGSLDTNTPVTLTLVVTPIASGTLTNTATAMATEMDPNTTNNAVTTTVTVPVDADSDGMPDVWELAHGLNPHDPSDASRDDDGDGFTNLQEYLAGTDPTNSVSGLQIISMVPQDNDVVITWTTAGGRTNVVQAANDAGSGFTNNFTDLSPLFIIPGAGDALTNYLDVGGATNVPSRFYRVRLVP
jgi:uncharacterized repeat protein (TIGR01451 family)